MVRLPQNVINAKEAFESENKIAYDLISNPRQVLAETPAGILLDYPNPTIAVLCQKKLLSYNILALSTRTTILSISPKLLVVAQQVALALSVYAKGLNTFPKADLSNYENLINTEGGETNSIPECLKLSDVISDILSDIGREIKNLFKSITPSLGNNRFIDEIVSKIRSQVRKARDLMSDITKPLIDTIKEIARFTKKVFDFVLNATQKALFFIFDTIWLILDKLGIIKLIRKLREMYDCLRTNCRPVEAYMVNVEDVMPGMMVNLPIDQYTGEFRVYKLGMYSDIYPDLGTSEGSQILYDMDSDYSEYRVKMNEQNEKIKNEILK